MTERLFAASHRLSPCGDSNRSSSMSAKTRARNPSRDSSSAALCQKRTRAGVSSARWPPCPAGRKVMMKGVVKFKRRSCRRLLRDSASRGRDESSWSSSRQSRRSSTMSATSAARATERRSSSARRAQTGTQMRAPLSSLILKALVSDYSILHSGVTYLRAFAPSRETYSREGAKRRSVFVSRAFGGNVEVARRAFCDARRRDDLARVARRQSARARRRRDGCLRGDVGRRGEPLFFFLQAEESGDAFGEKASGGDEHPEPPDVARGCPSPDRERDEDEGDAREESLHRALDGRRPILAAPTTTPPARVIFFLFVQPLGELARDGLRHEADVCAARAAVFSIVGVLRRAPRTKHRCNPPKENDERGTMNDELDTTGFQFIVHRSYFRVRYTTPP